MRSLPTLFLLACAAAAAPLATHANPAGAKWLRLTSEHFEMFSCISESASRQLLVELEQFREFYFTTFQQHRNYHPKVPIFLFDTEEHYTRYRYKNPDREVTPTGGLFLVGRLQSHIMVRHYHYGGSLSTLIHEYVHFLTYIQLGEKLPLWFKEGLAEVCDSFRIIGNTVIFGKASYSQYGLLGRTPPIPLDTLFTIDSQSPYYTVEGVKRRIFYAQSWLLLHYAMLGKNNEPYTMKNMLRFVDARSSSSAFVNTAWIFKRVFGTGYGNLEKALYAYLRDGAHTTITTTIPSKPIRDKISVRPATDEEREIALAGLDWRSSADNIFELYGLARKYPENPRIYEILAVTQRADSCTINARYLRKAVEKNSANPLVYVELLKSKGIKPANPGRLMPAKDAAEYTVLVDRALELAPDCMEAYELLAIIESQSPVIRIERINTVLEALPHMRERDKTRYALAVTYWRLKRHDDAQAMINKLLNDPNSSSKIKSRARELQGLVAKETGRK